MAKVTDLDSVKRGAMAFVLYPVGNYTHPAFGDEYYYRNADGTYTLLDFRNCEEDLEKAQSIKRAHIENATSAMGVFYHIDKSYRIAFLHHVEKFLSRADVAEMLGATWVDGEGILESENCNNARIIKLFKRADKKLLMSKEDYQVFVNLPAEFTVYRGVSPFGSPTGLSWTLSSETAEWFAKRFDSSFRKGYVFEATAKKEDVLAYFNDRNEQEIVIDRKKLENVKIL